MKNPRYKRLVEKSVGAALSAIEIYNKPDFKYREETFAILMINAWELLLKAKIIRENNGKLDSIYEFQKKKGKDGNLLKRLYLVLNRSGNPKTKGLMDCLNICENETIKLDNAVKENIILLMEIRDIAIHFQHTDKDVSKKVFEIGTASLKNYLNLITDWFGYDLSRYHFFLMPMTFFHEFETIRSYSINSNREQIKNLLKYISEREKQTPSDECRDYNITLKFETKFVKSTETDSLLVHYSDSRDALQINVTEEDALKGYPFDYGSLTSKMKERYTDFKENQKYHDINKTLKNMKRYYKTRLLDPNNSKSPKKHFYSPEVFKEFDKYYTKK